MNGKELDRAEADMGYWEAVDALVGWTLLGFTYRQEATYIDRTGETIHLTGPQRDDIVAAIRPVKVGGDDIA